MVRTKSYLLKTAMLVMMLAVLVFPVNIFAETVSIDGKDYNSQVIIQEPGAPVVVNSVVSMSANVTTDYADKYHLDWSVENGTGSASISQHKGALTPAAAGEVTIKAVLRTGQAEGGTGGGGDKQAADCAGTILAQASIPVTIADSLAYGFQGDNGNTMMLMMPSSVTFDGTDKKTVDEISYNVYHNTIKDQVEPSDGVASFGYAMSKGMNNFKEDSFNQYKDQIRVLTKEGQPTGVEVTFKEFIEKSETVPEGQIVIQAKDLAADTDYILQFGPKIFGNNAETTLGAYIEFAFKTTPSAEAKVGTVTGVKAVSPSYNSVKVSWKAVDGATSYEVYRSPSKAGAFKRIGTAKTTSYTDKSLKTGTVYYYQVRAYKENKYGEFSTKVSAAPKLAVPTLKVTAGKASATLKWSSVPGKSGYQLYRTASLKDKYTIVTTTQKTGFTDKKVKSKKTYYYKVMAYKIVSGKAVYGSFSTIQKVKTK